MNKILLLFGACLFGLLLKSQIISTVAGVSQSGYTGDGGFANSSKLSEPMGCAVDAAGNVYIADSRNHAIRKVSISGIVTTIAGNGTDGFYGDGGLAINSQLNNPTGVAVDKNNNIYIADHYNQVIRKINTSGIITTIVGTGVEGYSGDGGLASQAKLSYPFSLHIDSTGTMYIAEFGNHIIRKVTTAGVISTIAGTGAPGFSGNGGQATLAKLYLPKSVTVDTIGNIFIADYGNNRIRRISPTGVISTYAGSGAGAYSGDGGLATVAGLSIPSGIAFDLSWNLLIADTKNNVIRKVDASTGIISTIAGTGYAANTGAGGYSGDGGFATAANLFQPTSIAVHSSGKIYFTDNKNSIVRRITTLGVISTFAGTCTYGYSSDGIPATTAWISNPASVVVDPSGNIYFADKDNHRIRKVNTSGLISTYVGTGVAGYSGDGGPATAAKLNAPWGVALDAFGNLYIADANNHVVRKVTNSGTISTIAGTGVQGNTGDGGSALSANIAFPNAIASDPSGNVYITDVLYNVVRKINVSTGIITKYAGTKGVAGFLGDGGLATNARLNQPASLAIDGSGNLYIADQTNHRIRKVNTSGTISTFAGTGVQYSGDGSIAGTYFGDGGLAINANISMPRGVAVDAYNNVYITESTFHKIRKVNPAGIISRIAGLWYAPGYNGDGGVSTAAQVNIPWGITCDDNGTVYFADNQNNVIRKIAFVAPVPAICMVTVDDLSTHNVVLWERPVTDLIDSFIVYREDMTNVYTRIASVAYEDQGEYHDYAANPNSTTKRYKLAALDYFGLITALSPYHNTIYIVDNGSGQFSWNPSYTIEPNLNPVNNYVLMRDDLANGNWNQVASTAGTQNTLVDPNYATYQTTANWRVETIWNISCDPASKLSPNAQANKSKSNVRNNFLITKVGENSKNINVFIAPNPVKDNLIIHFPNNQTRTEFEITDILGKLVIKLEEQGTNSLSIQLTDINSGVYFLRIRQGDQQTVKKFVKE